MNTWTQILKYRTLKETHELNTIHKSALYHKVAK